MSKNTIFNHSILLLLSVFLLIQCKSSKSNGANLTKIVQFSIETTTCYGTCPVFKFQIFNSGEASYHGIKYVERLGKFKSKLNKNTVNELLLNLEEIEFYDLNVKNNMEVFDLPSTYIFAKNSNGENKILYYYPKNKALDELIAFIEGVIEKSEWTERGLGLKEN